MNLLDVLPERPRWMASLAAALGPFGDPADAGLLRFQSTQRVASPWMAPLA